MLVPEKKTLLLLPGTRPKIIPPFTRIKKRNRHRIKSGYPLILMPPQPESYIKPGKHDCL
jgi:hypothetical protein